MSFTRKKTAWVLVVTLLLTMIVGCTGNSGKKANDGKVTISVGNWPAETSEADRTRMDKLKEDFMKQNPDIEIVPDTWTYSPQTFMIKASGNQLPTLYSAAFTEAELFKNGTYAADIRPALEKSNILNSINPDLLAMVTDKDGRVVAWPREAYAQGLFINKSIFKQAGLVNDDGSVKVPTTYQELAEYGQIIREKTGLAGLAYPTTGNCGGWHLMNLAWSFGVEFEQQDSDGKWKAVFDTQEFRDVLQYMYDLKWKYNALQDDSFIDAMEQRKQYGTSQAAMTILDPNAASGIAAQYGMNMEDIMAIRLPEGPEGRYSQMGGQFWVVNANATSEQIEACVKWLEFTGLTPKVTEESKKTWADTAKTQNEKGAIVFGRDAYMLWVDNERTNSQAEAVKEYVNVDMKNFEDYFSFDGVTIRPEPSAIAQELYAVLDSAIQSVITDKNVNIDEVAKNAAEDFQINHLDKMDY